MGTSEGNLAKIDTSLSPMQQAEILLHEYDTLRDELVENIARQQTTLAIFTTILVAFLAFTYETQRLGFLVLFPTIVLIFLNMESGRQFSILVKSEYVGTLERRINKIVGCSLLNWEHMGSTRYLYQLRIKDPTKNTYIFNSHLVLLGLYPALVISTLLWGLYKGGQYLYVSLGANLQTKVLLVTLYEVSHMLLLGLILFSRLIQEKKILSAYKHKIQQMHEYSD